MSHSNLKLSVVFTAMTLCLTVFTLAAIPFAGRQGRSPDLFAYEHRSHKAGLDSYEIYLNNKLLLKQAVDRSFSLKSLRLDPSNSNDQLVIYYSQCNAVGRIGKGRSIAVKDGEGRILKEWKFADAGTGTNAGMAIPVKELLQLAKDKTDGTLSVYYYASEARPEGQVLASFS